MERIAQGRSATLTHTFYVDGVPTDPSPDAATVTVTRADGTALVPAGSVTEAGTGVVTLTLTPAETVLLDTLKVTWSATFAGQPQAFVDYVEIVGGFLFSVAEARAVPPLNNTTTYTTSAIVAMRTTVETALEQACSRAFVPRYTREILSGTGTTSLLLSRPDIRAIRDVTVDDVAYTAGQLADLAFNPSGGLYSPAVWTSGFSNVVVGFEHGMAYPPPEVTRAALTLAKMWLVGQRNPIDDRAITFNTTEGGTYSLAVPGRNGSVFGQPDVDAVISRYDLSVGVA